MDAVLTKNKMILKGFNTCKEQLDHSHHEPGNREYLWEAYQQTKIKQQSLKIQCEASFPPSIKLYLLFCNFMIKAQILFSFRKK